AITTKPRIVRGIKRITSYGHEEAGLEPTRQVLRAMHMPKDLEKRILPLVKNHMFIFQSRKYKVSDAGLRRLIVRLYPATLQELVWVAQADYPHYNPAISKLLKHAEKLDKQAMATGKIKPILKGRDLIKLGFKPGPEMGKILKKVFEAQVNGKVKNLND